MHLDLWQLLLFVLIYKMLIQHEFQVGSIVLAKFDVYPHWPAKILTCLKNGSYKVMFLEERSEAIILPNMVTNLDQQNLLKLKRGKHSVHRDLVNESIRITQKILQERERANREIQESGSFANRRVQTRRSQPQSQEHNGHEATHSKNQSIEKDIYSEIKQLLDKLSKSSANLSNSNKIIKFTPHDEARLYNLLTDTSLETKLLIDKFIIQRLIVTMGELEQWGCKQLMSVHQKLRGRFKSMKREVLTVVKSSQHLTEYRKKCLLQRLRKVEMDGVEQ